MTPEDQIDMACQNYPEYKNHIIKFAKQWKRNKSEYAAMRLQEYGVIVDVKDFGADQGIELGAEVN